MDRVAWKVFSNPIRQEIIGLLEQRAHTTGELCESFELSRFAVMQHLKVLEEAGVVRVERRGRYRWNHLDLQRIEALRQRVILEPGLAEHDAPLRGATRPQLVSTFFLPAAREQVFEALTTRIGDWWNDNDAAAVVLEPWVGGRFWKRYSTSGNGVLLGTVDKFWRNEFLGFYGSIGSDNTISIVRFRLEDAGQGQTRLVLSHHYTGEVSSGAHEAFEQSWQDLIGIQLTSFLS